MSNKFTSDDIMNQSDSNKENGNDKIINKTFTRKKTRNKFGYFIKEDEKDEIKMSSSFEKEESDNYYGQFTPGKDKYILNNDGKENISDEKENYKKYKINSMDEVHNEDILISTERNNIQVKEMNIKFMTKYIKEKRDEQNENKNKNNKILINENNIVEDFDNIESDEDYYTIEREINNNKYGFKNNNNRKIKIKQIPNFYEGIKRYNSPFIRKNNKKNSLSDLNCNKNNKIYRKKNPNWNICKKVDGNKMNPNIKKEMTKKNIKIPLNIKKSNNYDNYCFTPQKNKQKYIFLKNERNIINKSKDNNNNIYIKSKNKKVSTPNRIYNDKKLKQNFKNINSDPYIQKLENLINQYSLNEELSIIDMIKCLYNLRIINELINNSKQNFNLNIKKIKEIINNIKENEFRKKEELQFIEQLWFILNPSMNDYINNKLFLEFLRILLTVNNKLTNNDRIKQLSTDIENLLNKYNIINEDKNDNELLISPLTNKVYKASDKWSLPKLVKLFLKINHLKGDEKDLTFKPNLKETYIYFKKYSKYNYYNNTEENSNQSNYIDNKRKQDFNMIYKKFMKDKELQEKTLEKMREIELLKELKKCTHSPKINKNYPMYAIRLNRTFEIDRNIPIYERLYNMRKNINANNIRNSKSESFDSKLEILPNNRRLKNNKRTKKAYDDYIMRNRAAIEEKENQRKLIEDKAYGKNYEKISAMKIKPFNITDLKKDNKKNNTIIRSKSKEKNKIINNIFVTIEIKIPNGQLKPFKIYKNINNTEEDVDSFCNMFNINEEDKKEIYYQVLHYKNIFFGEKNNDSSTKKEIDTTDTYDYEHCSNEF